MPVGKPLHLRLFLEGEEVPVVAAQVTINTSSPATASIQIVPLDSAMDMLPRTMVHLFFLDTKLEQVEGPSIPGDIRVRGTYRLLFSGEVVGFAWNQTPATRGLVLQCLDFSNYWDSAHVHAVSYGPGGNAFDNQGSINGAAVGAFTNIPGDSAAEHLVRWIKQPPTTPGLTNISGLAGGVIHIMEAMGGVLPHYKGVNDFYTIAELRCRLLNQITAEENDSTASRVLSIGVFEQWLKNGIEQAGGNVTFRDVMKLLFQYIYYEFVPNPAPKFDPGSSAVAGRPVKTALDNHPTISAARAELEAIFNVLDVPTDPPEIGPDAFRLKTQEATARLAALVKKLQTLGSAVAKSVKDLKEVQATVDFMKYLDATSAVDNDGITHISKLISTLAKIRDIRAKLGGAGSATVTTSGTAATAQRLRAQIIRPDCWFASPPACNVLFPETYASISYDRNFLQETTRSVTRVFNTLVGRDNLLSSPIILAPQSGFDAEKLAKFKGSQSFRILMDHEIHVGIIPKSEWLPNTSNSGRQGLNTEEEKKVKNGRLNWMVKASLFNFFKYRFAARQVQVAGRFNPFVVCGFPGAVITRPYAIPGGVETLREIKGASGGGKGVTDAEVNDLIDTYATELNAPSHFVGMIGAVQHSVDQSGGTTNVVLHHARKHRGIDDEFLGVLMKTSETATTRTVKTVIDLAAVQTSKAKDLLLLLSGVTPQSITPKQATQAAVSSLSTTTKVTSANRASNDPRGASKTSMTTTSVVESSAQQSSSKPQAPDGTEWGHVPGHEDEVWVPSGSTSIKVNDKKGRFKGRILGIEVLDANITKISLRNPSAPVPVMSDADAAEFDRQTRTDGGNTLNLGFGSGNSAFGDAGKVSDFAKLHASLKKRNDKNKAQKGVIDINCFNRVAIYEEVSVPVNGTLPIEEVLRPSWFSTAYANDNIGTKIYRPFFGCGSVVEGLSATGVAPTGTDASADETTVDATKVTTGDLMKRLTAEESNKRTNSLEKALNILGYIYGQVKTQGMDVDSFVRDYTDRPIATLQEIFGDSDLTFNFTAGVVGENAKVQQVTDPNTGAKRTPLTGYHTAAVHPDLVEKGNLVGLVSDLSQGFTRAGGIGADEPLVTRYDVRKAKKARVLAYLTDLERGPGFKG